MNLVSLYNIYASQYSYMSSLDCSKKEYKMTCEILSAIETIVKERIKSKEYAAITPTAGTLLKTSIEQIATTNLIKIESGLRALIEALKIAIDLEMTRIALAWTNAIARAAAASLPKESAFLLENDLISTFDKNFKPLIPSIIKASVQEKNIKGIYILSKAINKLIENELEKNKVHG